MIFFMHQKKLYADVFVCKSAFHLQFVTTTWHRHVTWLPNLLCVVSILINPENLQHQAYTMACLQCIYIFSTKKASSSILDRIRYLAKLLHCSWCSQVLTNISDFASITNISNCHSTCCIDWEIQRDLIWLLFISEA